MDELLVLELFELELVELELVELELELLDEDEIISAAPVELVLLDEIALNGTALPVK